MNESQPSNNKKIIAVMGLLVIAAVIGIGLTASGKKDDTAATTPSPTPTVASTTATPAATSDTASAYKDGTYSATGTYQSPGGRESIQVSVTLNNGAVTDTSAVSGSTNPTGQGYQAKFISGYKPLVVGKNIDEISLSRVSGSSLTSGGFSDALDQIKSQAKG